MTLFFNLVFAKSGDICMFFLLFFLEIVLSFLLFFFRKFRQAKKKKVRTLKQRTTAPCTRLKSRAERDYSVLYYQII